MQAARELAYPGELVRSTIRIAAYWVSATLLLWVNHNPLKDWPITATLGFLLMSSVLVTGLGYAASLLRLHWLDMESTPRSALSRKISQTGAMALEILAVLSTALMLNRLM